jgi:LacI family transcriptional regulator
MITLSDIAKRAGVSVSVVSRVLNDDPALRIRPATRDRVRKIAKQLDYTPNFAGRALRNSKAGAIGLIVPDMTNAIFDEVTRGVEAAADELNVIVLLGRSERLRPGSDVLRRLIGEGRVDGFVVQRRDEIGGPAFEEILERNSPIVLINSRSARRSCAVLDDIAGASMATRHLIDLGHRDIALIGGDSNSYTGKQRERGFVQTMAAAGIRRRTAWTLRAGYFPENGRRGILELFDPAATRRPTGIVVGNINAAIGAVRAAGELGIRVPEELSVVAVHETWVASYTQPPMTTVKMPLFELGREAVRLLHERLSGGAPYDSMITEPGPQLILRGSTAPPA